MVIAASFDRFRFDEVVSRLCRGKTKLKSSTAELLGFCYFAIDGPGCWVGVIEGPKEALHM